MDLWFACMVPYTANLMRDGMFHLSVVKKKGWEAMKIPNEISRHQWAGILIMI